MGLSQSRKFNPANLPDLSGKVFVITGGACVSSSAAEPACTLD